MMLLFFGPEKIEPVFLNMSVREILQEEICTEVRRLLLPVGVLEMWDIIIRWCWIRVELIIFLQLTKNPL